MDRQHRLSGVSKQAEAQSIKPTRSRSTKNSDKWRASLVVLSGIYYIVCELLMYVLHESSYLSRAVAGVLAWLFFQRILLHGKSRDSSWY